MALSIYRRLGLGEVKPSTRKFQLADRFTYFPQRRDWKYSVKVKKFVFLVDFVVLDVEDDKDVPIIIGRPFLDTIVVGGEIIVRVNEEQVVFNIFNATE